MGTLWQDLHYGLRILGRNAGFTALVVVILGLGIGATTVMLSVVDATMLRPCPYGDPDTLVCVWETDKGTSYARNLTSQAGSQDWQEQSRALAQLVGVSN